MEDMLPEEVIPQEVIPQVIPREVILQEVTNRTSYWVEVIPTDVGYRNNSKLIKSSGEHATVGGPPGTDFYAK